MPIESDYSPEGREMVAVFGEVQREMVALGSRIFGGWARRGVLGRKLFE